MTEQAVQKVFRLKERTELNSKDRQLSPNNTCPLLDNRKLGSGLLFLVIE